MKRGFVEAAIHGASDALEAKNPSWHNRRFQREVGFAGSLPTCPLSYSDKRGWPGAGPVR